MRKPVRAIEPSGGGVEKGSVEMAGVLVKNTTGWVAYKQQKFGGEG